jgi:glycosyltransferase involved in cell wall biosynthesis
MNQEKSLPPPLKSCGIIIPVYNSDSYLDELFQRIQKIQERLYGWEFKIVAIDDGSNPPLVKKDFLGMEIEWIRHNQNQGKGAALKSGFRYLLSIPNVDPLITMDGDMQHPPELIPEFLKKYQADNAKVIIGSRKKSPKLMPFHRILSNAVTSLIISLLIGQFVRDSQCGFRLYSREVIEKIKLSENRFHLESEMIIKSGWQNYKINYIPVPTIYNEAPSAIRNFSDTINFITLIIRLIKERLVGSV